MSVLQNESYKAFLNKNKVTILVTDSGLGGVSICAEIAKQLTECRHFKEVSLVYFNAWPEQKKGYNKLKNTNQRIQVFDKALQGMMAYQPDLILIACNTLSILYPQTAFSQSTTIPVMDIIDYGVDQMHEALLKTIDSQVIILGTVTTIESRVHQSKLEEKGVEPHQIVSQACDQLATTIEQGPTSQKVLALIERFMRQATEKISSESKIIYAALCCTHFAYSQDLIANTLAKYTGLPVFILDPNRRMSEYVLSKCQTNFESTEIKVSVVSKIFWDVKKTTAISKMIKEISPIVANSLTNYNHIPNLF